MLYTHYASFSKVALRKTISVGSVEKLEKVYHSQIIQAHVLE